VNAAYVEAGQPDLELTSWFRSPDDNLRVGGLPTSLHLFGLAIDVTGDWPAFRRALMRRELGTVDEQTHLHVQLWPAGVGPRPVV
jgi:hypothetical protein